MPICPDCDMLIHVAEEIQFGKVFVCADCQMLLEVISREPVKFRPVEMDRSLLSELVEGDWGD